MVQIAERKATVFYKGDGVTSSFTFSFRYLQKKFVKVKILSSTTSTLLVYGVDYTVEDFKVVLKVAPVLGVTICIYRETPTDSEVEWVDGSTLRAYDMNKFEIQLLHISEENRDKIITDSMVYADSGNAWDAKGRRIVNVGYPVDPQDVVTQASLENTLHRVDVLATEAAVSAAHSEAQSEDILKAVAVYVDDAKDAALSAQAYSAPQWDETKDYVAGAVVTYSDGSSYRALVANTGVPCTNVSTWKLITTYRGDDFFEIDMSGNIMPAENPSYSTTLELDDNGNIQPKAAGV